MAVANYTQVFIVRLELFLRWLLSGFGGAEVACWPLISKFAGSNPAEAVGFLKDDKKNPQHAFLRTRSKIIGPMSQICGI